MKSAWKGILGGLCWLCWLSSLAGCQESHEQVSSGSNWLTCSTVADCESDEAVSCSDEGYCLDDAGDRIAVPADAGDPSAPDAGNPEPDASETDRDGSHPDPDVDASDPDDPPGELCAWGLEQLLAEVPVEVPERRDCGSYNSAFFSQGMDCFREAVDLGEAAELTINYCIDCSIPTTYVATAEGEFFAVSMEDDSFGDELREAKVERCSAIEPDPPPPDDPAQVRCVDAEELYQCSEPRAIPRAYKVRDVPADGAQTATLHLYVSNQSFDNPLIELEVLIEDTQVVFGDFAVEGQHNWLLFDITVPVGTLSLRARSFFAGVELGEEIEVPAERWAVLDYWYTEGEGGESFTFSLHDMPVAFN